MRRLAIIGCLVLASLTWRARKAHEALTAALEAHDRYIDMGVVLRVVRQDMEHGTELLPGKPPLVVVREHRRGGILDTSALAFVAPSLRPIVWYCAESAEELVLHPDSMPLRLCLTGAMGFGKTTSMVQWLGFRALELTGVGGEIGVTAPTIPRLGAVKRALFEMLPRSWWAWRERDHTMSLRNGITFRLLSTHQSSEAEGSPIQGYSWLAAASDEIQDSLAVDGDIEARGRDALRGRYKRFATCTVKESPEFRAWKDRLSKSRVWSFHSRRGLDSPFTDPSYWRDLAETMAPREYQRKVLAMDVGPERATYPTWDRRQNLRPVPRIGAEDVTSTVLAPYGRFSVLVGHDPGALVDASVILKAYRLPGERRYVWWVVDEVTTEKTTTEEHAIALVSRLRDRWGLYRRDYRGRPIEGDPGALVRADPYSENATERKPDKSVYTVFANHGLDIRPATYSKAQSSRTTIGQVGPGVISKDAGIEMVVQLLCSASGTRRLFVATDEHGEIAAPKLVAALESSERDIAGRAEWERKGREDRWSHWPCALRYALWDIEKPVYMESAS